MAKLQDPTAVPTVQSQRQNSGVILRTLVIGLMAFLTVVDLFATQALLPTLAKHYDVSPAAMGLAVNSSTMGMAFAGLAVAIFSQRIDRRKGVLISLTLLAIPTCLLAFAPNLATFAALRITQGICMSTAFSLTLAYLGAEYSPADAAGAFAAYITGNVASNLVGRLIAASVVNTAGLAASFYVFAALNLAGAALAYVTVRRPSSMQSPAAAGPVIAPMQHMASWLAHIEDRRLLAGFGIGFCILFAFIGTFTYVNFVLVRPPLSLGMMAVGLVYFVFLPSIVTTPFAGRAVRRFGTQRTLWGALAAASAGLPLLLVPSLPSVLAGMVLVASGTFFAQAIATGYVNQTAMTDRAAASGIYLASYFLGGLVGSAVLGQLFDRFGWGACVGGVGMALATAAFLVMGLKGSRSRR